MAAMDAISSYDRMKEVKEFDESKMGVKGLSDSGITSIPRIFLQPPETLSDLQSSSTCTNIPVINLSNINSNDHRLKIVEQVKEATKTWGFFQVKAKFYKREEIGGVMYASKNDLYRANAAAWHDSLQAWMGPEAFKAKEEDIPEICRKEVVAWDKRGTEVVVGHCYPYCPQPDLTVGITPHTDPGVITVLLQNHVAGLQVKHGDEWVNVKPVPGAREYFSPFRASVMMQESPSNSTSVRPNSSAKRTARRAAIASVASTERGNLIFCDRVATGFPLAFRTTMPMPASAVSANTAPS
uniref:Fe2OG dioxygenase domain-containing protein n=1 Tax=Fagus sylvatica TaxID=28930 RepID=A0A2N9IPT6_FAGSY